MKVVCPKCGGAVAAGDVNMAQALLFCRRCNEMFPLRAHGAELEEPVPEDFALGMPPSGAWREQTFEGEAVGGSCRSIGAALFTFIFAASFGGLPLGLLISGELSEDGLFGLLFLIPFLAVGLGAVLMFLVSLAGKTEVELTRGMCRAFTGVGTFGWKKEFFAAEVTGVYRRQCGTKNNRPMYHIVLERENGKPVKFGMLLPDARQIYLYNALKLLLKEYRD